MRVLHLLDSLHRGGAETLALDVCRNAARFGIELTVATCTGGPLESEFGADLIRLPRRLPVDPRVVKGLRRVIEETGIEIVHGHQAVDGMHIHLSARGLGNVKTVLSHHGFVPDTKNRLALRYLIPRVDANIVVSEGLRTWLREWDGLDTSKLKVLYNGVDPARLNPAGHPVREEIGIAHNTPLAGMVGNFYRDPRKDQLTVVKALPRVLKEVPNTRFLFAGRVEPGAEKKLAECAELCERSGIADRVHFLGPRSDIPDILAALDLFVISSLQEGLPIALKEAMLASVPVLASDISPHIEASRNGEYAELFGTRDENHLARKMISLLNDPARRGRLAEDARRYAAETFSIDAHLANLKKLYETLLRREGRR